MNHDRYSDTYLRSVFDGVKTIAVVGFSPNPDRASHYVAKALHDRGYRIIPVNPGQAGKTFFGETTYASLADIPEPVDLIDVFRRSEFLGEVVDEVLALSHKPKTIWIQLGLRDDDAAAKAEAAGIKVVMDRCAKVDAARLNLSVSPAR